MAFENVFGNINWALPVQQANADRQYFADMLGRGIQQAQFKKQMALRERQLEQQASQTPALKGMAEQAAIKAQMGAPLSPQEQAALRVMGTISGPQVYTDQYGNQVVKQSGWKDIVNQAGMGTPYIPAQRNNQEFSEADLAPINQQQIEAMISNQDLVASGAQPVRTDNAGNMIAQDLFYDVTQQRPQTDMDMMYGQGYTPYTAPERFGARGEMMTEESKQRMAEEVGKGRIEQMFDREKELKNLPKQERRILESAYKFENVSNSINEAIDMADNYSAGVGSITSIIPATPARNLQAKLNTIKADAAFGALQEMRDNSKTGGALGQVSERELALLESAQAPLDQAQSPAQLRDALRNYQSIRLEALGRVANAFEQDYGYRPKGIDNMIGSMTPKQSGPVDYKEYFK